MIDENKLILYLNDYALAESPKDGDEPSDRYKMLLEVMEIIEEQPKVGEWILCGEKMPNECEHVLVWFEYFRFGNYNRPFQTYGISYTFNGQWSGFVNGQSGWSKLKILAWKPLPEPYGGSSND